MESRKIVLGNLLVGRNRGKDIEDRLADIAGKGVGGTNQERSTDTYIYYHNTILCTIHIIHYVK